jgi:hypothetical protein
MNWITNLITPVTNVVGTVLKNRGEMAQAKHQAKMQVIQNEADWESKMADASANSWKDEWFTVLLSIPLLAIGWGIVIDDTTIIQRVSSGFQALENLPDWYSYLLFLAVSASFGVKGVDKIMGLKKK